MDMISWAATLSSTKLVLLAKVVAEVVVAGPGEAAGVVVTAEVVEAAEAEAVVVAVAVAVEAAGVTAEIAVVEAEETDAGNGFG
jgi:hypothetical protein